MLACLCNDCHLKCSSQVMPNLAWRHFLASLLDNTYKNKIDCFTYCDRDRETKFEIYLLRYLSAMLVSFDIALIGWWNWLREREEGRGEKRATLRCWFPRHQKEKLIFVKGKHISLEHAVFFYFIYSLLYLEAFSNDWGHGFTTWELRTKVQLNETGDVKSDTRHYYFEVFDFKNVLGTPALRLSESRWSWIHQSKCFWHFFR